MKKITLKETEHRAISKIIDKYRSLETNLTEIQVRLETIDKEKTDLLSTLDKIRNDEVSFFSKMKKTYGEGKLDVLTMEYIVTK